MVSKVIAHTTTKVKDDMPLYTSISRGYPFIGLTLSITIFIGAGGEPVVGATFTHTNALDSEAYGFAKKLVAAEYFEVEN